MSKVFTESTLLPSNVTVIGGKFDGNAYSSGRYLYNQIKRDNHTNYLTEGIDFEINTDMIGGTIVFSIDVFAIPLVGWKIGKCLHGRYIAKNGKAFGENSLSIDLVGINTDKLLKIATKLCNLFTQESVLIKDYNTQKVYFVNGD